MDFLYISPEFPPNYANFVIQLNEVGINVWALGEADFYAMPEPLRAAIKWYIRTDLKDFDAVKRAIADMMDIKVANGGPKHFNWVESHNEQWLRLEGKINEAFGFDGIQRNALDRLKKKSVMKTVFQQNGLTVAEGERVADLEHGLRLGRAIGYPLILKPDEGVGASGIYKIETEKQLIDLLPSVDGDYVLESFVDGRIVTFDGLTDHNGRVIFENSLVYGDGVLEYVLGKDTFFYVNRLIPEKLGQIGRRMASLFDIRRKFFHFEFFIRDDEYLPIEINCRPPGGSILDMMNYSIDDDLYRAYALMIATGSANIEQLKKYYVCYLGRKSNRYVHDHTALLAKYGHQLVEYDENPPLYREAMGQYRYIFRAKTEDEIADIVTYGLDKEPED
jgi:hypothetical protein